MVVANERTKERDLRVLRVEAESVVSVEIAIADLRNEPEVRAEVVAVLRESEAEIAMQLQVVPGRRRRERVARPAVPGGRKLRLIRILRIAVEKLPRDRVRLIRPPEKVGTDDAIVSAAADLAVSQDAADVRLSELVTSAPDDVLGAKVLRREVARLRAGDDRQPAATVVRGEHRVRRISGSRGGAETRTRRCDRPRVRDLERCVEEVESFEEERPLLLKEDRETLVDRDLRNVGFDLREIGVDRRVDRGRCRGRPLQVGADVVVEAAVVQVPE